MLKTEPAEIVTTFAEAKNLNAALKNFLKKEGRSGEAVQNFAKSFRAQVVGRRPEALNDFVAANYPKREVLFLGLARYAHPALIETIVGQVIEKYAENFNATYTKDGDSIQITDRPNFEKIVREVVQVAEDTFKENGVKTSNFLMNAVLASIFEPEVLKDVIPVVQAA